LGSINAHLQERVFHAPNLAQNLQYFYGLEGETGIQYLDLKQLPEPPKKKGTSFYTIVRFNLTIKGDYNQLLFYLQHLETQAHFCRVTALTLRQNPEIDKNGHPVLQMTLSLDFLGLP